MFILSSPNPSDSCRLMDEVYAMLYKQLKPVAGNGGQSAGMSNRQEEDYEGPFETRNLEKLHSTVSFDDVFVYLKSTFRPER